MGEFTLGDIGKYGRSIGKWKGIGSVDQDQGSTSTLKDQLVSNSSHDRA